MERESKRKVLLLLFFSYVLCALLTFALMPFRWRVALLFAPLWTYSLSLFFFIFFFFQKPSGSMFYELVFTLCKYRQIERDCMSLCCCSIPPPSSSNLLFPLLVFWLGLTALLELGHQLNNRQLSKIKPIGIRKTNNKANKSDRWERKGLHKRVYTHWLCAECFYFIWFTSRTNKRRACDEGATRKQKNRATSPSSSFGNRCGAIDWSNWHHMQGWRWFVKRSSKRENKGRETE